MQPAQGLRSSQSDRLGNRLDNPVSRGNSPRLTTTQSSGPFHWASGRAGPNEFIYQAVISSCEAILGHSSPANWRANPETGTPPS